MGNQISKYLKIAIFYRTIAVIRNKNLGFGIPASKGVIPFCSDFSIGINKRDDILNSYSHFMTEIINLKNVVLKAAEGKRCFAVF